MPSQPFGLMRRMAWADFPGRLPTPPPTLTQPSRAAEFAPKVSFTSWTPRAVPGGSPPGFEFPDDLTATVFIEPGSGRVAEWLKSRSQANKDGVLKHEQGPSYDIAGPIARDFSLEAMQLEGFEHESMGDAADDLDALKPGILGKLDALQDRCDKGAGSGSNAPVQSRWNAMINTVFTSPRSPPATAAKGVPLKARLLDVLRAGGVSVP